MTGDLRRTRAGTLYRERRDVRHGADPNPWGLRQNVAVPRLLQLFDRYEVPCTFFVPEKVAEDWPEIVRAIYEIGHQGYRHVDPSNFDSSPRRRRRRTSRRRSKCPRASSARRPSDTGVRPLIRSTTRSNCSTATESVGRQRS
ncbi:hypothetical protein DQW50_17175 [Halorubrum sp. 48-1-W]|nr:hypothetical protein DQW50_17175 [Halorubrum sp. 48-1-W]